MELANGGRTAEAISRLEQLVAEHVDAIAPRELLAKIHFHHGNLAAAEAHVQWLTCRGFVTPRLAVIAAAIALDRGDADAAMVELAYAQHVEPGLPGGQSLLGAAHARRRRSELAEECFQRAIRQDRRDTRALVGLAAVALHDGRFEETADRALAAIELDPRLWRAHLYLGIALACLNRMDAAKQVLEAAARLNPARTAPYRWLALIAHQHGDQKRAGHYRTQARAVIRRRREENRSRAENRSPDHRPAGPSALTSRS